MTSLALSLSCTSFCFVFVSGLHTVTKIFIGVSTDWEFGFMVRPLNDLCK